MRFQWLLLALCLLPRPQSFALEVPSPPDHYVTDAAGLLSPGLRARLEEELGAFERETSNQILVAIFSSLEGESIESFGIRLAERWRPGQSGRDNGVILLVSQQDRKARIEVGYGLEAALPDATAKSILHSQMLPRFQQGDFDGGVQDGVRAILQATAGEYRAVEKKGFYLAWILFLLILFFIVWALFRLMTPYGLHRHGHYRGRGGSWGGYGHGGTWGSGSRGGFRGGGGGFGGGGASGGW